MPQHPDSYELSPHWTMVGEHGFRGEPLPHPTHLIQLVQPEPGLKCKCINCGHEAQKVTLLGLDGYLRHGSSAADLRHGDIVYCEDEGACWQRRQQAEETQAEVPDICSQMEQMELPAQPTMLTGVDPEGQELWSSQTTMADGKISPITQGPLADELLWAIASAQHYQFGSMIRIWRNGQNWDVWPTYDDFGRRTVKVAKCGPGGKVYTILC